MITIVGAGKIGSNIAGDVIKRELSDILLIDVLEGLPQGEALDLGHMAAVYGVDFELRGTNCYKDMKNSDLIVVTAGFPRRPGMTRLDLLHKNGQIIKDVSFKISKYAPESKVLMVTNPLDVMTYVAMKITGFQAKRVFGMGSILDSARFRYYISKDLNVPLSSVKAIVIGEHGENMLPLSRYSTVSGRPLTEYVSTESIRLIIEKTCSSAAKVISLKGATVHAPISAAGQIIEGVLKDTKELMPLSTYLNGEYGIMNLCIGVLAVIGKNGIEEIKEIRLQDDETKIFLKGAKAIKKGIAKLNL